MRSLLGFRRGTNCSESPHQAHNLPCDPKLLMTLDNNWSVGIIFSNKLHSIPIHVVPFDGRFTVYNGNNDLALIRRCLVTCEDVITVENPDARHTVSLNLEREHISARRKTRIDGQGLFDVLNRQDRLTGRNATDQRDLSDVDGYLIAHVSLESMGRRLMWPFFSSAASVVRTPFVEAMSNWSIISRIVGG